MNEGVFILIMYFEMINTGKMEEVGKLDVNNIPGSETAATRLGWILMHYFVPHKTAMDIPKL